ncbi:hypothetical protein H6G00_00155 [Leptolyngbya sp. FACHB-541]|uniref:hypothetical protein n=1 Tax=Leptolyngbya sp. FACHB-541 TaxID=2692810 RepID=UPI001682B663|nr:hypothetical protein [Leptolyngbya sp. FACHB-541]MBD1995043.1 hypothetical protein [Leptolyngbya sp. FACHB-541]
MKIDSEIYWDDQAIVKVDMLAFERRTDPNIEWSHTARVADGLNELKEAIALCFQMGADHFVLSIHI